MTDQFEIIESVRDLLLSSCTPSYQTTNKKEVRVRCPYCGDSQKDSRSAHMYIAMKPPFLFHCFKCETSGALNQHVLKDLGIYNTNISISLINANRDYKQFETTQKLSFQNHRKQLKYPDSYLAYTSDIAQRNLNYFNNRFGSDYTIEELQSRFKCVVDPDLFFKENNIFIPPNPVFNYSEGIGFVSSDSSHIIFRDVVGIQGKRYNNLNLIRSDQITTMSKIYNISNEIDLLQPRVELIIAEGVFDIIGVFHHFYRNNFSNKIFAAACGKSFYNVILNYVHMGFLNLDISIYSDGDVDPSFYREMKRNSPYLKSSKIDVYYNSFYDPVTKIGKDYGCKREEIGELRHLII